MKNYKKTKTSFPKVMGNQILFCFPIRSTIKVFLLLDANTQPNTRRVTKQVSLYLAIFESVGLGLKQAIIGTLITVLRLKRGSVFICRK